MKLDLSGIEWMTQASFYKLQFAPKAWDGTLTGKKFCCYVNLKFLFH